MALFIAVVHYPSLNKHGRPVATAVTNFDLHDIARAARTYGLPRYYVVTPVPGQREFAERIMRHWIEDAGAEYNPSRGEALQLVEILPDLGAVGEAIVRDFGREPFWVATSARAAGPVLASRELRARLDDGGDACLLFGTGYGLHPDLYELVDATLEPIVGPSDFNHLAVRSAVAIYLDRLLGRGR